MGNKRKMSFCDAHEDTRALQVIVIVQAPVQI